MALRKRRSGLADRRAGEIRSEARREGGEKPRQVRVEKLRRLLKRFELKKTTTANQDCRRPAGAQRGQIPPGLANAKSPSSCRQREWNHHRRTGLSEASSSSCQSEHRRPSTVRRRGLRRQRPLSWALGYQWLTVEFVRFVWLCGDGLWGSRKERVN